MTTELRDNSPKKRARTPPRGVGQSAASGGPVGGALLGACVFHIRIITTPLYCETVGGGIRIAGRQRLCALPFGGCEERPRSRDLGLRRCDARLVPPAELPEAVVRAEEQATVLGAGVCVGRGDAGLHGMNWGVMGNHLQGGGFSFAHASQGTQPRNYEMTLFFLQIFFVTKLNRSTFMQKLSSQIIRCPGTNSELL